MTGVARYLAQASVLLDLKRYDEAASLLARIVAAEPQDSRAWCLLAAAHLGAGRHGEAAAAASSAITLAPSDERPYRLASIAQRHLGKITAAISSASQACKLAPDEWRAYICLAQALLATETDFMAQLERSYQEYFQDAERAAATAVRLAPDEPDAHFTAGQVSYAQRQWKAARAHQERALTLDPAHSGALNELGRISLRRGGSPRAASHFIQAARSAPGVSTYGRNAELSVRRVLAVTTLAVYLASWALLIALSIPVSRWPAVLGYTVAIALAAGYGAVQLWRMPPEMRLLLRTHRAGLALGALCGAVLIEVITAAVIPAGALPLVTWVPFALIIASLFAARGILRRLGSKTGRDVTQDRAVSARCLECGAANAEGTEVCTRCGAPIILQPFAAADLAAGESGNPIAPLAGNVPHQLAGQRAEPGHSRRDALIMAGVGLVMLAAVTAVIATSSSSAPSNSSASPASATSASPVPSGQQLTEDQLQAGACLTGSDLHLDTSIPWPEFFTVVPCTQQHIAEVYFAANIWPQSLAYPGDDKSYNQAVDRCASAFFAYVAGSAHDTAAFTFNEISPDGTTWPDGDRLVVCIAYEVTDQYPDGAPVDYSIKGSRQ